MEINRVLKVNCSDVNALLSKAEALYGLGLFEKSMIQHYRGIKIRPDFQKNIFSKGIRYGIVRQNKTTFNNMFSSVCKIAISEALKDVNFDKAAMDAVTKKKLSVKRQRKRQSIRHEKSSNRMERDIHFLKTLSINNALKDPVTLVESSTLMFRDEKYLDYRSVPGINVATFPAIIMQSCHAIFRRAASDTTVQLNKMIASSINFLNDREKFWEETKTF